MSDRTLREGPGAVFYSTHADDYPKPFRTAKMESQLGGTVKTTDLVSRFAWKRRIPLGQFLLSPQTVFDETYQELVQQHGYSDADATEAALDAARAAVQKASAAGMHKAAARLQPQLLELERKVMSQPQLPHSGMDFHPGASRPDMNMKTPSGLRIGGIGTSSAARLPQTNGSVPRQPTSASQVEQFSYTSVDGRELTFTKRVRGALVQDFLGLLSILCAYEVQNGGTISTVLEAAGISLQDDNGQALCVVPGAEPEPELPRGLVDTSVEAR